MSLKTNPLLPIAEELKLVARELTRQLEKIEQEYRIPGASRSFFKNVIHHLFKKPGKQLRPALMLYAARISGALTPADKAALIQIGAAIELIHSASLVHDDIIDESRFRRNQLTLGQQFGNSTAVLVGDILYAQFFSIITELPVPEVGKRIDIFRLFCHTTKEMCYGEIWENHLLESRRQPDFEDYIRILETKTAVLMSAACQAGALYTGASPETLTKMKEFGMLFGIAYQLADDHIDGDSLLKGNLNILRKADSYITRAKKVLKEITVSPQSSQWASHMNALCDFIAVYARTGDK